ncbi:hypothetical protein HIM_00592 [Hirsutella minnesotensis 3608]|nr:hypothetical protein HIM_00592 [Hirsutella minnesotensis 3608]
MALSTFKQRLVPLIWGTHQTNAAWQRIVKYAVACTITVILALLPRFKDDATFLIPMVAVFANPGQRMGVMVESLLMLLFGAIIGLSWSLLGLYLASLVEAANPSAANTIRGVFIVICVLFHGYVRSSSPRLTGFVLFMLITVLLSLQLPSSTRTSLYITTYTPVLLGVGVLLCVNLAIFPELSSSYLGSSTIDTLSETIDTLTHATHWFVTPGGDSYDAKRKQEDLAPASTNSSQEAPKVEERVISNPLKRLFVKFPNPFRSARDRSTLCSLPFASTRLAHLTQQKPVIRSQLARCKAAQDEVNFEICISPLPPTALKPISVHYMTAMVQNVITLIGACENKFVVVGKHADSGSSSVDEEKCDRPITPAADSEAEARIASPRETEKTKKRKRPQYHRVNSVKPIKEMTTSSSEVLESILARVRDPVQEFRSSLAEAANLVVLCLAYCYDVPRLPSGALAPKGIPLEEIDLRIDYFSQSLALFDSRSTEQLKRATMDELHTVDFMPGMETFLVSSFILALRDSALQLLGMLRHLRRLIEKRQLRHERSRLWIPQYTNFRQWVTTGGEADAKSLPKKPKPKSKSKKTAYSDKGQRPSSMSSQAHETEASDESDCIRNADEESVGTMNRRTNREGSDRPQIENPSSRQRRHPEPGLVMRMRARAADVLEWFQHSEDLDYALKLAVALFLVLWPGLVESLKPWYNEVRGIWAPMQLILVFEVAIGTSIFAFTLRLFGVVFGCVIGFLASVISGGNRIAMVAVMLCGIIPSVYIQVATDYVKAGMIAIVSMNVVALASVNGTTPAYEVFYKRLVAFLIGGFVAMLVEIVIAPVRARDRLVDSLSSSVRQIQKMQAVLAVEIDEPKRPDIRSQAYHARFNHARDKAQLALTAAEAFLPFCLSEPRLKGSFKPLAPIYDEIIYVLHQIIDRMDNVMQLRRAYGSPILEDLNPQVYAYRRSVAASSTLILFSINEALTTWLPLPQFIASARLAHLRLISRVQEILTTENAEKSKLQSQGDMDCKLDPDDETTDLATKRRYLSWNASTAGQLEIIEYMEELVELVKLLVGVNAFKSGMLERPTYRQYIGRSEAKKHGAKARHTEAAAPSDEQGGGKSSSVQDVESGAPLGRAATVSHVTEKLRGKGGNAEAEAACAVDEDGLPRSLQRVGTRLRRESTVVRRRAFTLGNR